MQAENLIAISTGESTYWPTDRNKLPDLIDFAVVKGLNSNNFITESCYDLTSDHSPIIIKLTLQIQYIQNNYFLYNKKTNWETYKAILDEKITCNIPLKTAEDIENAIEDLNIKIHEAINLATPIHVQKTKTINISKNILDKIKEKRKLRKIWQSSRSKIDKMKLNKAIKELKRCLHDEKKTIPFKTI